MLSCPEWAQKPCCMPAFCCRSFSPPRPGASMTEARTKRPVLQAAAAVMTAAVARAAPAAVARPAARTAVAAGSVVGAAVSPTAAGAPVSATAVVFFFQAEDGIRDVAVTGVQTCALPISGGAYPRIVWTATSRPLATSCALEDCAWTRRKRAIPAPTIRHLYLPYACRSPLFPEIGRASCRERV